MFIVIGVVIVELVKEIPGQVFAEVLWQLGQPHGEGGQGTGDTPCGIRIIKIFCERGTGGTPCGNSCAKCIETLFRKVEETPCLNSVRESESVSL